MTLVCLHDRPLPLPRSRWCPDCGRVEGLRSLDEPHVDTRAALEALTDVHLGHAPPALTDAEWRAVTDALTAAEWSKDEIRQLRGWVVA